MTQINTARAPDVLVVGAGSAGLVLACELLRRGVPTRIVERNDGPKLGSEASVVHSQTLEVFEDMGFAAQAVASGRQVRGLSFFVGDTCVGRVGVDALGSYYPFMLGLLQREAEILLEQRLRTLGGRVERGTEFVSCAREGATVVATIVHRGGADEAVRVPWLVGCDGPDSRVRQVLGLPLEGSSREEAFLQADVRVTFPRHDPASGRCLALPENEGLFFASPRGPISVVPLHTDGRYRLQVPLSPKDPCEPTLDDVRQLLHLRAPAGIVVDDPTWIVTFKVEHRVVPCYRVANIFLVGDAAHVIRPMSGQGMNLGIQDAYNLAWKLALVAQGRARPALLDSYTAERYPIAATTLEITDATSPIAARILGLEGQVSRDQVVSLASRLPVVEDILMRALGGSARDYRSSPIVDQYRAPLGPARSAYCQKSLPGPLDWIAFERGPLPGERVGNVLLDTVRGRPLRLMDLVRGPTHTLLLFAGASELGFGALSLLAAEVRAFHGDVIEAHVVAPPGYVVSDAAPAIPDMSGALHRKFGARSECLYVIRPDGYVGYRSQPADPDRLLGYLDRIFA